MKKTYSTKKALLLSILSLCLCIAMLAGSTFAWFTDSVKSENNIIQTGNLDVAMYWAEGGKDVPAVDDAAWTDASKGAMFNHGNWEPGYAQARHILIANEGSLALNYKLRIVANGVVSKLADVIDVYYFDEAEQLDPSDLTDAVKLGTLAEILGTAKNLSNTVKGSLEAGKTEDLTLVLKMQESADNDYQNMDLGCTFSVELIATQMAHESDSFGNNYDENGIVPDAELPAALVRPLEDLKIETVDGELMLNAGYKFQPTMGRPEDGALIELKPEDGHLPYDPEYSVENSAYRDWHADFVVKADREVPANSIQLAGYYSVFCNLKTDGKWVPMTSDQPVAAEAEIRLVEALSAMSGWNITVSYNDLCLYGNDGKGFMCGLAANDPVALAGTTITVELRMYETYTKEEALEKFGVNSANYEKADYEENPEDYVHTIGTITYTFPHVYTVSTVEDLRAAAAKGGEITLADDITLTETLSVGADTVIIGKGKTLTYSGNNRVIDVPKTANGADLTIKDLVIDCTAGNCERGINYNTNGTLTLDNVTLGNTTKATYGINLPANSDGAKVNITNSDLTANIALNIWGKNVEVNVVDSDLCNYDNATTENYGTIVLNNNGEYVADGTVINVIGGSVTAKDENGNAVIAVQNGTTSAVLNISDSTTMIGNIKNVVAIITFEGSDNYYASFNLLDMIEEGHANVAGAVLKLMDDIDLGNDRIKIPDGHKLVLDLNGKTITSSSEYAITNKGTLTIIGSGKVMGASEAVFNAVGEVIIDGDIYDSKFHNVTVKGGNIKNCTFDGFEILGGTFEKCTIDNGFYAGGTFDFNPPAGSLRPYHYVVDNGNGTWTVVADYQAFIGETGYFTFADALNEVKDGETIVVARDIEFSGGYEIWNKKITIDLDGHTLSVGGNYYPTYGYVFKVTGTSEVLFKDGRLNGLDGKKVNTDGNATFTLENVS